ncbi:MAG: carbohydrate kinase family protein [Caldilineaceae bacterium]|nr:carbohydrate kinase family protein [Caldilineaceae bacterium]
MSPANRAEAIEFVALSNLIIDDIRLSDGRERLGMLGGAAVYAATGLRLWSQRVGIISGVGEDFNPTARQWLLDNGIDLQGVTIRHAHTPRSWVVYDAEGERAETPQHGSEHFRAMESAAGDIPPAYQQARGLYIFRDCDPAFWQSLHALPAPPAEIILWEISAAAAAPEWRPRVKEILQQTHILSINRAEASALFQTDRPHDALYAALEAGAEVVALRLGAAGSLVTNGRDLVEIPALPVRVVDVTGGGNAYSGGFLAGYAGAGSQYWPDSLERAARCGAAAASAIIEQYGPPRDLTDTTAKVRQRALSAPVTRSRFR